MAFINHHSLLIIKSPHQQAFKTACWLLCCLLSQCYLYQYQQMANNYDWVTLQTPQDYKFFACVIAQKLRNTNFKPAWRQAFLKTLVEQLKPVCTYKAYERIQKLLNDVGNQKHQEEKELEEKLKKQSNVKQKNLKSLKADKVVKKYDINDDEESFSDQEDQEF